MNKREVIERIKKEIGPKCDDKMAEFIFKKALKDKQIIVKFDWEVISEDELEETDRGEGGFGSTGD